jgi:NEDD4-binding protein 2
MKNIIILRGVSGSGKSSFAKLIAEPSVICTADDYFTDPVTGQYNFDFAELGQAHAACRSKFDLALANHDVHNIVVANTNTRAAEFKYYEDAAIAAGAKVFSIVIENRHGGTNVHHVPTSVLDRQTISIKNSLQLQ